MSAPINNSFIEIRSEYLADEFVSKFVDAFVKLIDGVDELALPVGFSVNKLPTGFMSRFPFGQVDGVGSGKRYIVRPKTLRQWFDVYWWNRSDYDSNKAVLDCLKSRVALAISDEDSVGGHHLALEVCREVMSWGFGEGTPAYEANMRWARDMGEALPAVLKLGRESLSSGRVILSNFRHKVADRQKKPVMNAGWTKYYSLALPDFIIYDGRVGAAMGLLVRRYLRRKGLTVVPEKGLFPWASGKGTNLRNPTLGALNFPTLKHQGLSVMVDWAQANARAGWILMEAISRSSVDWVKTEDGLRRLEAALFMLGYDFREFDEYRANHTVA